MRTCRSRLLLLASCLWPLALPGQDTQPPLIEARFPAPGVVVQGLNSVEVIFDEPVIGVEASDLLINNVPATDLLFGVPGQFVFEFPTPAATGQVTVAFAPAHGITDLADPPNAFAGGSWSYLFDPNSLPATFQITEFMASNKKTLNDENGDASDWVEIHNPGQAAGNLEGWFLTDDVSRLTKWRFPNRTLEANAYLVVFASGKNRTNQTGNLHTSFQLSTEGEYLALVDPNTNIVSAFSPVYPAQQTDVSYGRDRSNPNLVGFFTTPTPRAPNAIGGPGFVAEVQFSHESRTFLTNRPFSLSLSVATPGASIYYAFGTNLPGSNTVNSFLYTGPLPITNTVAIRTRAFAPGLLPGPITTKSYLGLTSETNVVNFNSDLPIMILHNYGQGIVPADPLAKRFVFVQTFETPCGRSSMTNPPTLSVRGMFHTRGSSTITSSSGKPAFFLEVRDEFDADREVPMLGLPAESDWVLYAPNGFEPALFHNPLAHALARDLGEYASRTRFFEVYLKDDAGAPGPITAADYQGIYVLEEKIKRDNNRVDIAELQPEHLTEPEVTGGYMFSIDRTSPGETQLSAGGAGLNWIEPGYLTMTNAARNPQRAWITGYLNSFNTGLTGPNYTNLTSTNFYGNYIDVDSWVTRHVHEVLTFNIDALRLSGYFFKDRGKKIQYGPAWDYDRTQGSTDGRDFAPRTFRSTTGDLGTDFFNFSPWWGRLFTAPDFWQAWIDKYQSLRRPGQPFHFDNIAAHINRLANEVREAQPRERARWNISPRSGNVGSGGFNYNFGPVSAYQNEVDFKFVWYSNRLDFIDTNLLAPPSLSSPGGPVTNATTITLNPGAKPGSALLYTLDGTDPRLPGGRISPSAFSNIISVSFQVTSNVHIVARSYNPSHRNLTGANNPPISSPWSGPVDAAFFSSIPPLRITELMYHPPDPPAGSTNSQDDFEYIEFTNIGGQPLNLNRFRLRGGVDFDFGNVTLAAGASGVLVRDQAAFLSRYGAGPRILGVYTNDNLANGGESLRLFGSLSEPILDFAYDDDWYPATDGAGFSLVIINPNAPPATWGSKASWRPSGALNGSPGSTDSPASLPAVVINEIAPHTDPPNYDAIELANLTGAPVDLGGWYLTDEFDTPKKFRIPNGTAIPANGYLVFYATNQANPNQAFGRSFNLASTGGDVFLFSGDAASSNLTGYAQGFDYGAQANGVTFGRHVISTGNDHFPTMSSPTLGAPNSGPLVGPIVISEISYHPVDIQFTYRTVDNCIDEYIELQNTSASPVPLFDPAHPTNTWRLRDAVDFQFPSGAVIPGGGVILVVPIDPANAQQAAEFRARNGVPAGVTLYGPCRGQLDNSGDSVELVRPDSPNPDNVPYILVERVKYSDSLPWPQAADGFGPVLQRLSVTSYGNDPANWTAGSKTPGTPFNPGAGPTIAQQPADLIVVENATATFTVGVSGPGPTTFQWLFNGDLLRGQTGASLVLPAVQLTQAGRYSCVVFNPSGAAVSSNATLVVRPRPRILQQPANLSLRGSTNTTDYGFTTNSANFTVVATGTGALQYQWRFNGDPIPGATSPLLTLANVGLTNDGFYDCAISDEIASLTTTPARLTVLLAPVFLLVPPALQTVVSNGTFTASVVIKGNPKPFRYEWREISSIRATNITDSTTNFFTSGPVTNLTARLWRLVIFNDANLAPGALYQFNVIAQADTDNDGFPDAWESQFGFDPNSQSDRLLDSDGDGLSNYAEYLAGTDPTNATSVLRLQATPSAGNVQLEFNALPNRTYTIESTASPTAGPWVKLADLPSQSSERVEQLPIPLSGSNRFYRLITPARP